MSIENERPIKQKLLRVSEVYQIIINLSELVDSNEPLTIVQKARIQHEILLWLKVIEYAKGSYKNGDYYGFYRAFIYKEDIEAALIFKNTYYETKIFPNAINQIN